MSSFFKKIVLLLAIALFTASSVHAVSILTVQQGGTGVGTITGIIRGNGTAPFSAITDGSNGDVLTTNGAGVYSFQAGGGSQDLQQVTDVGNTTTNDIIGGALYAGSGTSTNSGLYLYDAANGVYANVYTGEDNIFGVNYNSQPILNYTGLYGTLNLIGSGGGAFDGIFTSLQVSSTVNRTLTFPDASGTLALSVNGNTADSAGNITISTGGAPGGSDTYVQYNDGGVFGGDSNFTWDKTNLDFEVGELSTEYNISIGNSSDHAFIGKGNWGSEFSGLNIFNDFIAIGHTSSPAVIEFTSFDNTIAIISDVLRIRNVDYTFPFSLGSAGSVLTDAAGDGILSWTTVGGGSGTVTDFIFTDGSGFDGTVSTSTSTPTLALTTSLTTGSVPFIGASGALNQDNAQFFFDNTNDRLGLGTASPTAKLDLREAGTGLTAAWTGYSGINSGSTFNTTAGVLTNTVASFVNTATRSAGANALTNIGLVASASGAQNNYAALFPLGNVGITQSSPLAKLHINTDSIGATQSDANGIILQNSTAATSGLQQYSPAVVFRSNAYLTTSAVSNTLDYRISAHPAGGTTAARGGFLIEQSLNGAGYSDMFEVGQTVTNGSGYQIKLNGATVFALGGGTVQFYGSSSGMGFYNSTGSVLFTAIDANGRWALTPVSLTTAATINTFNIAQTWNNASGDYTGINVAITNTNSASTARLLKLSVGGSSVFDINTSGGILQSLTTAINKFFGDMQFDKTITAGGTTGAQTINKNAGTVNFAAAATTLVVTNSRVTTGSIITATAQTDDTTCSVKNVVPAAGSFTITMVAACTAETAVSFIVIN